MLSNSSDRKHPQASIWLNYSPYGFRVFLTQWPMWPGFCSHPQCGHVLLLYPLSACSCLLFLLSQPLGPDRVCRVLLLSHMASPPSFNPPCAAGCIYVWLWRYCRIVYCCLWFLLLFFMWVSFLPQAIAQMVRHLLLSVRIWIWYLGLHKKCVPDLPLIPALGRLSLRPAWSVEQVPDQPARSCLKKKKKNSCQLWQGISVKASFRSCMHVNPWGQLAS